VRLAMCDFQRNEPRGQSFNARSSNSRPRVSMVVSFQLSYWSSSPFIGDTECVRISLRFVAQGPFFRELFKLPVIRVRLPKD
jgi:hypothetical protein